MRSKLSIKKQILPTLLAASLTAGILPLGAQAHEKAAEKTYSGEDMCISILAEGFLTVHDSFALTDTGKGISKEASDAVIKELNAASGAYESLYVSAKIPFAYDYGDGDDDVLDSKRSDIGTAMLSIAAGNTAAAGSHITAAGGIAPEAQVLAMKVYSTAEGRITAKATVSAIEDSVRLGADVILMEERVIGGAASEDTEAVRAALMKASEAGVIVVCPAGDTAPFGTASIYDEYELFGVPTELPDVGMIAYPGIFDSVLTVGSAVSNELVSPAIVKADGSTVPYGDSNYLYEKATQGKTFAEFFDGQTLEYAVIDGIGTPEQLAGAGDIKGKLAVIDRGELSFSEKAVNAAEAGAVGVIIADVQTNETASLETKLELTDAPVPVILVSAMGARYLKTATEKRVTISVEAKHITKLRETPSVSDSSARGTTPELKLKPDITAVGDKVECVIADGTYAFLSSTAASAAKVAGMCAVLGSVFSDRYPDLDRKTAANEIKTRLVNSAVLMNEDDGSLYSPRAQGGGAADLEAAMNVPFLLTSATARKIELGDNNSRMMQFRLCAKNISDTAHTVTLDAIVGSDSYRTYSVAELDSEADEDELPFSERLGYEKNAEAAFTDGFAEFRNARVILGTTLYQLNPHREDYLPFSFTLAPGESTGFDITVYIDEDTYRTYKSVYTNGFFIEGFMRLSSEADKVSIPMLGFAGDFSAAPALDGDFIDGATTVYDGRYLYRYLDTSGYTGEGSVILGTSLPANITEETEKDRSHIAFSPTVDSDNAQIYLNLSLLRTVTDVKVTVTDENGRVVHEESFYTVPRTYSRQGSGMYKSASLPVWNGRADDNPGYVYPEGRYKVTVSFRKPSSGTVESFSYELYLDTTAPVYESYEYDIINRVPLLSVNASDNFAVRSITVTDSKGHIAVHTDDGSFDLSSLTGEYIYIDIFDHALNSTVVRVKNPTHELLTPKNDPE